MARPLVKSELLRARVDCYFSPLEKEQISANAKNAGLCLSTYIRNVILGHKVIASVNSVNLAIYAKLSRTTSNLNQITRQLNEGKLFNVDHSLLVELREQVQALRLDLIGNQYDSKDC